MEQSDAKPRHKPMNTSQGKMSEPLQARLPDISAAARNHFCKTNPHPGTEVLSNVRMGGRWLRAQGAGILLWHRLPVETHYNNNGVNFHSWESTTEPCKKWRSQFHDRGVDIAESISDLARLAESIFRDVLVLKF